MNITDSSNYSNGNAERRGNWMQTFTGKQFWPLDPRPEEVDIEDIAHAISNLCRYAGHCDRFYSVAEHSVLVSLIVPPEDALVGLLHDATEAYLVDIPRPVKRYLTNYIEIEDGLWDAVAHKFEISATLPDTVKQADNAVLLAEFEQILKPSPADICIAGTAAPVRIVGWEPQAAKMFFKLRFAELTGARKPTPWANAMVTSNGR